ncbi:MAG: methyltransferase, TIGR04325 family [Holosporales bacterium]|jgi:putative methyltransferase (TIGR04325 family)|nr:methyltransferase, TIGR04325 family [Holosporales bacterium]
MTQEIFSVWEGVYSNFAEVGGDTGVFESDHWINRQKEKLQRAIEDFKSGLAYSKDYPLSLVVAMLIDEQREGGGQRVKVLDFGGGMGLQYLDLITKVPSAEELVDYTILDNEKLIDATCGCMKQFKNLSFVTTLSVVRGDMDIVHMGSSLQYVEKWQGLLAELNEKFRPKYFVFSDLLAGDIPTFVSAQVYFGQRCPVNMLNKEEFTELLFGFGFKVLYCSLFKAAILGYEYLPNQALPEQYQMEYSCHMVFKGAYN